MATFGLLSAGVTRAEGIDSSTIKKNITLVLLNDCYEIAPQNQGTASGMLGGMARIKGAYDLIRNQNPHTLFLHAGDFLSSSVASILYGGKQMIDVMNLMEFDAVALGNHEFEFGLETLLQRMKESRFQYLAANVKNKKTGTYLELAPPHKIFERDGIKIGVFSLTTADTKILSFPGPDIEFEDYLATAKSEVVALKNEGADVIVALTHLGLSEDRKLALEVSGIDLILGGHEHHVITENHNGVPLIKAGHNGEMIAKVNLEIEISEIDQKIINLEKTFEIIPITSATPENTTVENLVTAYEKDISEKLDQKIATFTVPADTRRKFIATQESGIMNHVSDLLRKTLKADIAFINAGNLRTERVLEAGPVTTKTVMAMFPFAVSITKVKVSGKTILNNIEHGLKNYGEGNTRFLHVSGIALQYDSRRNEGNRIVSVTLSNGATFSEDKTYDLAIDTFLLEGGDGFSFPDATRLIRKEDEVNKTTILLKEWAGKEITPSLDGRSINIAHCEKSLKGQ